jgi:hypothetical protein
MRYASAKSQEMKAPFNNLPMPTNDDMVNPIHPDNPDSEPVAAASWRFKSWILLIYTISPIFR